MPEDVFNNKAFSLYPIISHVVQSTVVHINIESSQLFFEIKKNNSFEQWKLRKNFETEFFFNLPL